MPDPDLIGWLMENGGPTIRYRTAAELIDPPDDADLDRLAAALLDSAQVNLWLARLTPDTRFNGLHGAKNTTFESAVGKLTQLGCRAGMAAFDAQVQPFRVWLAREIDRPADILYGSFPRTLVSAFLLMAGYHQDPAARAVAARRLDTLYRFVRRGDYDIYVDPVGYPGIPAGFRGRPLVDPALCVDNDLQLPWVYDLYAFAHLPADCQDAATQRQVDAVIAYILHPDYQRLAPGYGIARLGKRQYYAVGWNVDLPGFFGFEGLDGRQVSGLVRRAALMAHFPAARAHPWFQACLAHFESFRTERGTYCLPRPYLREDRMGYWVGGNAMGLEVDRRSKRARELESTFWVLAIRKTAGLG